MFKALNFIGGTSFLGSLGLVSYSYYSTHKFNNVDANVDYWFQHSVARLKAGQAIAEAPYVFTKTAFDPTQILNSNFTAYAYAAAAATLAVACWKLAQNIVRNREERRRIESWKNAPIHSGMNHRGRSDHAWRGSPYSDEDFRPR